MSIELHCNHCGQKIRAPDSAAGRWGKCPRCDQGVYIPSPADEAEEIDLAPIDEEEERRAQRKRAEVQDLEERIRVGGADDAPADATRGSVTPSPRSGDVIDLLARYVEGMAAGRMAECDEIVASLIGQGKAVAKAVKRLMAEAPKRPELSAMPPAVVKGYLKQLLSQL